ncbi:MAG: tRNA1(Val) (adenine(37)-N6)-methyltransferase [Deltaproteobacteria bacterium]|nr:tRNA1(Val) (adenine(37)-N6)-methyltransferase [Deltaproteobacteria bacterium]
MQAYEEEGLVNKKTNVPMPESSAPRYDDAAATTLPTGDRTLDALFKGQLRILQSRKGYRFSLDAVLLATFASPRGAEKVVDLGAGSGVVSLILAKLHPSLAVTGLEIQETMVTWAQKSARLNQLASRVTILQCDVRRIAKVLPPGGVDLVVCNPPYRKPASGRVSPDAEKRIARHEIAGGLIDFVQAGAYLLRVNGRMAVVYPAVRTVDLLAAMRAAGLEPKRLRMVYSFAGAEASLVLVEGAKGGRSGMKILAPLVIYEKGKQYGPEVASILAGAPQTVSSLTSRVSR